MIIDPSTPGPRMAGCSPLRRALFLCIRLSGRLVVHPLRDARRHWALTTLVLAIWCLAYARVFVEPTPHLPILFNWTPSVPYKVALVQFGHPTALNRGDFIVYRFDGEVQYRYPGLRAQPFFKQIRGVPGDRITVVGRQVFVNGTPVGVAKAAAFDRHRLEPIGETVIPPGWYYVHGPHPDSFDSRYRESGLVRANQVIGRVTPLF